MSVEISWEGALALESVVMRFYKAAKRSAKPLGLA